jgi:hypothetical protein
MAPNMATSPAARKVPMTSMDDQDARWQSNETEPSPGHIISWLATVLAVLIVIFAVGDFFISWALGYPILRIVALIAAIAVWLTGRVCRGLMA